jgi:type I restriction enzyme, S subunit
VTVTELAPWLSISRWPTVPIRYVAKLGTGHTPSRQEPEYWKDCTVPWITLADVWQLRDGTRHVIKDTKEKISHTGLANSAAVRHPAGTVILSRTASVGFSAIMGADMATSQDFATWTCSSRLLPKFLMYALRATSPDLRRIAAGSTHKTIYMPDIEQLRIPLPRIEEQRRIADFLDAETARIDELTQKWKSLKERTLERRDAIVERVVGSASNQNYKLFRALRLLRDGTHQPPARVDSGIPLLTARNVSQGNLWLTDMDTHVSVADAADLERSLKMAAGDILLSVKGTVGACALVPQGFKRAVLDRNLALLRPGDDLHSEWLLWSLRSKQIQDQIRLAMSFAAQPGLALGSIRELRIPFPPHQEQRLLLGKIEISEQNTHTLIAILDRQFELLAERRQALITAAVTGQIDVSTTSGRGVI